VVRRSPYRWSIPLGAGVLVAGAVVAFVTSSKQPDHPAKTTPAVETPSARVQPTTNTGIEPSREVIAKVSISIVTNPDGAKVTNAHNHELLGVTPYRATLPRSDDSMEVVVEKAGYQAQTHTFLLSQDNNFDLSLIKEPDKPERPKPKNRPPVDPNAMRKL
jgi:hypothetical protein